MTNGGTLLYGGSFDPIHHGHLISAQFVADRLGVDRVILIPCAQSPLKRTHVLARGEDRLEMCRRAAALDRRFDVSDWELKRPPPSYSVQTARYFRSVFAPSEPLYWLLGQDSLATLQHWASIDELAQLVTFVTASRPGGAAQNTCALRAILAAAAVDTIERNIIATPLIDISASEVRARVSAGRCIEYLVPAAVAAYIAECALYRNSE